MDAEARYPSRSFCILEMFAAVAGNCTLQRITHAPETTLLGLSLDAEHAAARKELEKHQIDDFIRNTVGFQRLNRIMRMAISGGMQ